MFTCEISNKKTSQIPTFTAIAIIPFLICHGSGGTKEKKKTSE